MIQAFYSGSSSLKAHQTAIDIAADNIANSNTAGFKQKQERFGDILYTAENNSIMATGATAVQEGAGSDIANVENDMSQGTLTETDRPLDYGIEGDGFFAVKDSAGKVFYTRAGSFQAAKANNGYILADQDGRAVLDAKGNPIKLDASGNPVENPGVFTFANSSALQAQGGGIYAGTALSGAVTVGGGTLKKGWLESSNVDLAGQITGLMVSQRAYEFGIKAVQTADSIAQMANQLK